MKSSLSQYKLQCINEENLIEAIVLRCKDLYISQIYILLIFAKLCKMTLGDNYENNRKKLLTKIN